MVKATELRIGNLVLINDEPVQIDIDFLRYLTDTLLDVSSGENRYYLQQKYGNHAYIPVTEQWLIKAGFTKGRKHIETDFYDVSETFNDTDELVWIFKKNNERLAEIKYVHQLQNLYFALTGQELIHA